MNATMKPRCTCGSPYHYPAFCPRKARKAIAVRKPLPRPTKRIARESKKHRDKRLSTQAQWRVDNPPDEKGEWACYLQIDPRCLIKVNIVTINYEHKESKVRRPDLVNDPTNIGASCSPCNETKGSRCLSELVEEYPHLRDHLV